MINVFVDESGDLGENGERYFVIVIFIPQNSKRVSNFIKSFCAKNNLSEVKASQLSFAQKQEILNKLTSNNDYSISYIVADKKNINNKQLFIDKNLLYNYLFSFLIKRTLEKATDDVNILLDNHSTKTKSINSLSDYVKIKAFTSWKYQKNLSIRYIDSKASKTIQATDVIANAIYAYYTYNKKHFYNMLRINESIKFPQKEPL